MSEELKCPNCGGLLETVRQEAGSMFNREQWRSMIAGDLVCPTCPDNGTAKNGKAYFWKSQLQPSLPKTAEGEWEQLHDELHKMIQCSIFGWPDDTNSQAHQLLYRINREHNAAIADLRTINDAAHDQLAVAYETQEKLRREVEEQKAKVIRMASLVVERDAWLPQEEREKLERELDENGIILEQLQNQRDKLREENRSLKNSANFDQGIIGDLKEALMLDEPELRKRLATAESALKWYADATFPDDGSGRPPDAFKRVASEYFAALAPTPTKEEE